MNLKLQHSVRRDLLPFGARVATHHLLQIMLLLLRNISQHGFAVIRWQTDEHGEMFVRVRDGGILYLDEGVTDLFREFPQFNWVSKALVDRFEFVPTHLTTFVNVEMFEQTVALFVRQTSGF